MVLLARAVTRLLGILVLVALAVAGLAGAAFSIQAGHGTLSLPSLASDARLGDLRDSVGSLLHRLEAHGPIAAVSALSGAGAILLGLVMLTGALVARRERLIVLSSSQDGVIAARRRGLTQAAVALAEQSRGVLAARVRARPWRRRTGGRLRVRVRRPGDSADGEVVRAVTSALEPLTAPLPLRAKVRAKAVRRAHGRPRGVQ